MPGISSLASVLTPGLVVKTSNVIVIELDDADNPVDGSDLAFQYFPDTISDTKGINWAPKEIPGGSLPLYQWVNSGERRIGFTAVFTTDTDLSSTGQGGNHPSDLLRISLKNAGKDPRNIDIRSAIYWLRRFMLPHYGNDTAVGVPLTKAPHKLRLSLPGTGIGWAGGGASHALKDSMVCLMTGCDVSWEAFFPSGFPRVATVALSFAQVAQFQGQVDFPSATKLDLEAVDGVGETFGYTITPKG